ncbi:hypothetical protein GE061_015248 [Apolygus lucorum]|uniref:Uncharacterized protein n=1 Tax=Apolygus lucorum TaxID=248454 RepID=A0A8S9XMI2_APOLU|nr:hypothetical protein GE061_015248 [Apolygus lucorum]
MDGRTASAYYDETCSISGSRRIWNEASIYSAEIYALWLAVDYLKTIAAVVLPSLEYLTNRAPELRGYRIKSYYLCDEDIRAEFQLQNRLDGEDDLDISEKLISQFGILGLDDSGADPP